MFTFYPAGSLKKYAFLTLLLLAATFIATGSAYAAARLLKVQNADGSWGVAISGAGSASVEQTRPLQAEVWDAARRIARAISGGYTSIAEENGSLVCSGRLAVEEGVCLEFKDRWDFAGDVLHLDRSVTVKGDASDGFLTAAVFDVVEPKAWPQIEWFAPGMLYGNFDLIPDFAIGGRDYYQPGSYTVRIREDRLPAPLMAAMFDDSSSLAVLNPVPKGDSTAAEAMTFSFDTMVDERFQFGAIGAREQGDTISMGYWFPGTEGEKAYSEKRQGVNGGQAHHRWRRRFHPLKSGFTQHYEVAFRFGQANGLNDLCLQSWRWAWEKLQPKVNPQNIELLRRCIVDALDSQVIEVEDRAGIPVGISSLPGTKRSQRHERSIMGFIGKTLETAEFMLAESLLDNSPAREGASPQR